MRIQGIGTWANSNGIFTGGAGQGVIAQLFEVKWLGLVGHGECESRGFDVRSRLEPGNHVTEASRISICKCCGCPLKAVAEYVVLVAIGRRGGVVGLDRDLEKEVMVGRGRADVVYGQAMVLILEGLAHGVNQRNYQRMGPPGGNVQADESS